LSIGGFESAFADHLESARSVVLAGRVHSLRLHGGIAFADLSDGTGRIQAVIREGDIEPAVFNQFVELVDQGDFIEVVGTAFVTKRGEHSILATEWTMLSKSLLPLPSEWYGIKDEETRYRARYLDILMNPDVRAMLVRRSQFWNTIRVFLLERGFIEVETPALEVAPGGADARPFVTHHNALDMDVYLRISAGELWQKRLLVAGFPKVFEIARIFRNEGISNEHLQDYTQMEFYEAYANAQSGMRTIQELYRTIAQQVYGTQQFSIRGFAVDLAADWPVIDYCAIIESTYGIDPLRVSEAEAIAVAEDAGIDFGTLGTNKARALDNLWKLVRKTIAGPAFLTGVPVELEPLAKRVVGNELVVDRFQVIIAGSEIGKGYSELNDPIDQRERFETQQALRDAGDEEAQRLDESFIEALEYGMPPAFGFGVSERLFSFFEDTNIRDAQFFPLLKPKE
jgi:lysyl-tRNA synthetase class 2